MREANRGAGASYIRGVTTGDIKTRQPSSVDNLKLSRRYLLTKEEVCLKLWCEGLNTEGVGGHNECASSERGRLHTHCLTRLKGNAARAEQTWSTVVKRQL